MGDLGNKQVLANNLRKFMSISNKSQKEICETLMVSESTFSDWINAKSYPRIDKIEILANYFDIQKADLIEENNKNYALKDTYFNFAKDMQEKKVSQEDLDKLWKFYDMIKKI